MAKKQTFTMTVIYDEYEIYGGNPLYAVEHALYNIDGIFEWESVEISNEHVEYDEE